MFPYLAVSTSELSPVTQRSKLKLSGLVELVTSIVTRLLTFARQAEWGVPDTGRRVVGNAGVELSPT